MADDVSVKFGAEVEGLLAGVAEAKEAIASVSDPIAELKSGFAEIAEATGAAFAVEKLGEFAEQMGRLGERTLNAAAATGLGVEQYSRLSNMLQLAGGDADGAEHTMIRLARAVSDASSNAASPAAKAFRSLGISQEELKAHSANLEDVLGLLAETFTRVQNSPQKTADYMMILGRGMQTMVPLLRQGKEGLSELSQAVAETGANLSVGLTLQMAETGHQVNSLGLAMQGLKNAAYSATHEGIDGATASLRHAVEQISENIRQGGVLSGTLRGLSATFDGLSMAADFAVTTISAGFTLLGGIIEGVAHTISGIASSLMALPRALPIWMGGEGGGFKELQKGWEDASKQYGLAALHMGAAFAEANKQVTQMFEQWQKEFARRKSFEDIVPTKLPGEAGRKAAPIPEKAAKGKDDEYQKFELDERLKLQAANITIEQIEAIYAEWLAKAKAMYGEDSTQFKRVLLEKQNAEKQWRQRQFAEAEQDLSQKRAIDNAYLAAFKADMEQLVAAHKISKQQMYGFEIQYTAQLHDQERARLQTLLANDQLTLDEKRRLTLQLIQLDQQYAATVKEDRAKIEQAINESLRPWKQAFDQIASAWGSAMTQLITGATTWQKAMLSIFQSVLRAFLDMIGKMIAEEFVWAGIKSLIGAGIGGPLGGLFSLLPHAKGGVLPFASGAVISSPVVFPMASGVGLAGEAGPEAILPLSRGPDGNLGVAGGGGGLNMHFYGTVIDGAAWLKANKNAIAAALASASRGFNPALAGARY